MSVSFLVTLGTKGYQVLGRVITQLAPRLDVVDLKILRSPARLATPAVPLQDMITELTVGLSIQLQAGPFGSNSSHCATQIAQRMSKYGGFSWRIQRDRTSSQTFISESDRSAF
jgi:hypothetical protein